MAKRLFAPFLDVLELGTIGSTSAQPADQDPPAPQLPSREQQRIESRANALRGLKVSELKDRCKLANLSCKGKKEALIARLSQQRAKTRKNVIQEIGAFTNATASNGAPPMYTTYREEFNGVDVANRRFYRTFDFHGRTKSPVAAYLFGVLTYTFVNLFAIHQEYADDNVSHDYKEVLSELAYKLIAR